MSEARYLELLRGIIKAKHGRASEVATLLSTTPGTVSRWLAGLGRPSADDLVTVAVKYGADPAELVAAAFDDGALVVSTADAGVCRVVGGVLVEAGDE